MKYLLILRIITYIVANPTNTDPEAVKFCPGNVQIDSLYCNDSTEAVRMKKHFSHIMGETIQKDNSLASGFVTYHVTIKKQN